MIFAQIDAFWFDLGGLLSLPALIALNGFFVAAEFALVSVRRTRVEEMVTQGVRGAAFVMKAIEKVDRVIAATQLGITLSSIALGWISEQAIVHTLSSTFENLDSPWNLIARHSIASGLAFFLITFTHIVFGELVPKTLALQAPDRVALWLAGPLSIFELVARPLISLIHATGKLVLRLIGLPAGNDPQVHSVEELWLLVQDSEEAGMIDAQQAEMFRNVFRLSSKHIKDVMVPREKMAYLELSLSPEKILEAVRSGAHTRMPVCAGDLDNIVGVVNTKDLFHLFSLKGVVILEDAMYDPLFLKPDEEVANALRLFRKSHRPMALVRDLQNKILGLITLEDILEEIIGDIEDEHDLPIPKLSATRRSQLSIRRQKK